MSTTPATDPSQPDDSAPPAGDPGPLSNPNGPYPGPQAPGTPAAIDEGSSSEGGDDGD